MMPVMEATMTLEGKERAKGRLKNADLAMDVIIERKAGAGSSMSTHTKSTKHARRRNRLRRKFKCTRDKS